MDCHVTEALRFSLGLRPETSFIVAYSGGVDSTVLLHGLVALRNAGVIDRLKAIHINHGLSEHAQQWEKHCQLVCDRWLVPLKIFSVAVSEASSAGLEQAARSARYKVFHDELAKEECLLQGHHMNDQAETLLFRLFRGTGIDGLSGIPSSRPLGKGVLFRPLLSVSRTDIEAYACCHQLAYIHDESNDDRRFSRNYIRHALLPVIEQRWPGASQRLAVLAKESFQVNEQLRNSVIELTDAVIQTRPQWLLGNKPLLNITRLIKLKPLIQQQVVRYWLKKQSLPIPNRDLLEKVFTEIISARGDACPLLSWSDCELRRHQGFLVASKSQPVIDCISVHCWNWSQQSEYAYPPFGYLRLREANENEKNCLALPHDHLIELRTRDMIDSGMKVAVAGRSGRKTIKRWLQDFHIPPWLRQDIPFLFIMGDMVAAPGLWVCEGYQAKDGTGYKLDMHPMI
ncbi:MAG: tRNA lysidine(34) synthetase TilS [Endozoicomonas sp. (ex Botrylloides leachii)]|nr:tRNA lysidine(34) synthetase TilS [Endozoicomonas sp. (ex Botrylloides leachii)]